MLPFTRTVPRKAFRSSVMPPWTREIGIAKLYIGILDFTKTGLGKSLLREWCLRPSLSIPIISARHDAVECFIRAENLNISDTIHTHLKGLRNAPRCVGMIKAGKANVSDWQAVVKVGDEHLMYCNG